MKKRRLGKTNLMVSEIGFGGEWLERHPEDESVELIRYAGEKGINIIDCWMPDPKSRDIIGKAMLGKREQVDAALAYETASTEEKDYASVIANAPFHSYKGECTYCGHCKPCIANLDIAMINKYYDLATMQPEVPATVKSHYMLLEHKASECIGCHACEARCPFEVPIAERMKRTTELFGC